MTSSDTAVCVRCEKRPGTMKYSEDQTAFAHGWAVMMCPHCVLEVQIAHCEAAEKRLPLLRAELVVLKTQEAEEKKDG